MTEAMPPDWAKWKVGMKVVCVDDNPHLGFHTQFIQINWSGDMDGLQSGKIYHIRDILIHPITGELAFLLQEIVRQGLIFGKEASYRASRFRPLQDKPDAIEWARQICRDAEKSKRRESVA